MIDLSSSTYRNFNSHQHWYVLYTRTQQERKVYKDLLENNITCYLPEQKIILKGKKIFDKLILKCFLFVKIDLKSRNLILQIKGIKHFVEFNGIPAIISDSKIETLKLILKQKKEVKKISYFISGKNAKIIRGPLKGITGVLVKIKDKYRFIIKFNIMMKAISFDIEYSDIGLVP